MTQPPATNRATIAARTRLERARASCQDLLQELNVEPVRPFTSGITGNTLGSSHDEVIS